MPNRVERLPDFLSLLPASVDSDVGDVFFCCSKWTLLGASAAW